MTTQKGVTPDELYELSVDTVKMNELMANHLVAHLDKDLTKIQIGLLMEINTHQPLSITELSEKMHMNYGNTSSQCKSLERKNYIIRKRDEEDERYVKLTLSENGEHTIVKIDEWMKQFVEKVSSSYSKEEWEDLLYHTKKFKQLVEQAINVLEGE